MKSLAALLLVLFAGIVHAQNAVLAKPKQVVVNVKLFQGDPLGSRKAGTLKCLADTRCITVDNRPFAIHSGGELAFKDAAGVVQQVPYGNTVSGTPHLSGDGTFKLDLRLQVMTAKVRGNNELNQSTAATQTAGTHRFGDPVKIQIGDGDNQTWAELVFEERD
jgi:hypothetical protein